MNKKILYIDLDGVLADFEHELYRTFPHLKEYEKGSKEQADEIDRVCDLPEGQRMFGRLKPMPGAIDAFHKLNDHYNVYILSTAMWLCPYSFTDKRLWVAEHLGEKVHKKLILSHNKGLLLGDYLIDDRIKNGVAEFTGEHIHFAQPGFEDWNKVLAYLSKKDDWGDL